MQGYALNEKRLRESQRQLADLKRLVQLHAEVAASQELAADQSDALLRILGDNALVALTLLIAESRPEDKDVLATLVINLINNAN